MTAAQERQCPTRTDGQVALFVHRVTAAQCQSRQRGNFHRCFTCAYNNAYVAKHGLPAEAQPEQVGGARAPEPASREEAGSDRGEDAKVVVRR